MFHMSCIALTTQTATDRAKTGPEGILPPEARCFLACRSVLLQPFFSYGNFHLFLRVWQMAVCVHSRGRKERRFEIANILATISALRNTGRMS